MGQTRTTTRTTTRLIDDALTSEDSLEKLFSIFDNNKLTIRVRRKQVNGDNRSEVFSGDDSNNTIRSAGGADVVYTRAGDDRVEAGRGNDLVFGGEDEDVIFGDAGQDSLYGDTGEDEIEGGDGNDFINGGSGSDTLLGDNGNDTIVGGSGQDNLTGGTGSDRFLYEANPFANGTPASVDLSRIRLVDQPDTITDFQANDQIVINSDELDIDRLVFQRTLSTLVARDSNVIVLQNAFTSAGFAANSIGANRANAADAGIIVYFDDTLGFGRVIYSRSLATGGDVSVLANLTNFTTLASLDGLSANNLALI